MFVRPVATLWLFVATAIFGQASDNVVLKIGMPGSNCVSHVRWDSAPGRYYTVYQSSDLLRWSVAAANLVSQGPTTTWTNSLPDTRSFYRLGISNCSANALLVNPCRPWLGATVGTYPGVSGTKALILGHEQRIGRQLDVVHTYHPVGNLPLSADEKYFATRANTILLVNWKPASRWADAAGNNATINAAIDTVANSVKSIAPKKLMFVIHHEPEDDVTPGTSSCPGLKGGFGSPADYRGMWRNVRNRFDARGATNVVWVMVYMGYSGWHCLYKELWPGNDLVDWVMWDPYAPGKTTWNQMIEGFYNTMETESDAAHDFKSKPWGLSEYGKGDGANQAQVYQFYADGRTALANNRFPRLKAYVIFDYGGATRIAYDANGNYDPLEVERYKALANDSHFIDPGQ
jgi:hypothetical protein